MIDKKKKKKRNNTANGPFAWVCFDDETNDKKTNTGHVSYCERPYFST